MIIPTIATSRKLHTFSMIFLKPGGMPTTFAIFPFLSDVGTDSFVALSFSESINTPRMSCTVCARHPILF